MPGFQNYGMHYPPSMGYKMGLNRYETPEPNSEQFRKLFIGGLSYDSDEKSLKDYFSKYGEIKDVVVLRDNCSKRSRGFGFITFKDKESIDEVQKARKHKVDERDVETKRAMPRDDPCAHNQFSVKKMFVGGLKDDTTEDMIRKFFSEYGNIEEVQIVKHKETGKSKGFCFVTFDDYDPVDKLVLMRRVKLNDREVEVKKAYAKDEYNRYRMNMYMQGPPPSQMPMGGGGGGQRGRPFHANGNHNQHYHNWHPQMYNDYYVNTGRPYNFPNNQNQQFNRR